MKPALGKGKNVLANQTNWDLFAPRAQGEPSWAKDLASKRTF